jgi:AhpC/TSA antioxidant enzyme
LRDREKGFHLKGASLAAVSLGDMAHAKIFRDDAGITFPLLVDEDRVAYRAIELGVGSVLSIFRPSNFQAGTRALAAGHRQHKLGKNPFQLGGSFIFGPGNTDIYAHANETFGDNAPVAGLLAALP